MSQRISAFPLLAYIAVTGFFHDLKDLKKDERGLSGVVTAVLLILVAVIGVVFLWKGLGDQLKIWWDNIVKTGDKIEAF